MSSLIVFRSLNFPDLHVSLAQRVLRAESFLWLERFVCEKKIGVIFPDSVRTLGDVLEIAMNKAALRIKPPF